MERLPADTLKMFTSCFAPVAGCATDHAGMDFMNTSSDNKGAVDDMHELALVNVERRVRKHVAAAISRRCDSLITAEEETLLTECEFLRDSAIDNDSFDSSSVPVLAESPVGTGSSGFHSRSTQDDDDDTFQSEDSERLLGDNFKPVGMMPYSQENFSLAPNLTAPSPSNIVQQESIKSRFDYMRGQQQFAGGKDPPSGKSVEKLQSDASETIPHSKSVAEVNKARPSPLTTTPNVRRNELAKQILRRRATNRGVIEP